MKANLATTVRNGSLDLAPRGMTKNGENKKIGRKVVFCLEKLGFCAGRRTWTPHPFICTESSGCHSLRKDPRTSSLDKEGLFSMY